MGSIFSDFFKNWVNAFEQEEGKRNRHIFPMQRRATERLQNIR